MAKKKINAKNNIREYPYEGVRRDNRIKDLAKQLKIKPFHLKNLVDQKLKPGVKVFGKRFFSNVDTMAGYLNEVGKKNLANTPRSEIKPIYDPAMGVSGITDAQKLKYLSKVHEIHPSVIKDALKAGANPKSLIKTMMSETIPSETISKWFRQKSGEKWKESNERKRSAKNVKSKIVPTKVPNPDLAKRANLQIKELANLGEAAKTESLWKRFKTIDMEEHMNWKRKKLKQGERWDRIEAGRAKQARIKQVKGGLMNTAAWVIADVLGERVIDPLTKKLVEKTIGPQLIKLREENERRKRSQ